VTFFLVAMTTISKGIEEPTRIIGYADDWVIYTSQRTPRMTEKKLQKAANEIVKWTKETSFNISVEKTKAKLIHRRKPRVYERPKLKVRLGPNAIEMVRQHRILGPIIDDRLNWKVHLKEEKARNWGY
jgi:hypothetical protein